VIKRIKWAENMLRQYREEILKKPEIKGLIEELKRYIEDRKEKMRSCGMIDICRVCEEKEGGSCCGKGIEERYDQFMILLNMLLGCNIPKRRYKEDSCLFLGRNGCILPAPHVLCINYVCKKIENGISKDDLSNLREIEGNMILAIFKLHEELLHFFQSK